MEKVDDSGEKIFGEACLRVGLEAFYQVKVGCSVIDYKVRTKKGNYKLVEVTMLERGDAMKNERKGRQIENMQKSGLAYCLLCSRELLNIRRCNGK